MEKIEDLDIKALKKRVKRLEDILFQRKIKCYMCKKDIKNKELL